MKLSKIIEEKQIELINKFKLYNKEREGIHYKKQFDILEELLPTAKEQDALMKEMYNCLNEIPCNCHEAYKSKNKTDPECPRCNFVGEELIQKAKQWEEIK